MEPQAEVGCRVVVTGLTTQTQYNGLIGTVISWDGAKGRACVKLDSGEGEEGLLLKPTNLLAAGAEPTAPPRKPFILFLHGLGDTGDGWAHLPRALRGHATHIRYSFPDAPVQPVSCNGGYRMTSWMDLQAIPVELGSADDVAGLEASRTTIHSLIDDEIANGTPSTDIVLGGFSQGGAMALFAGFTYHKPLAGIVCLSGWPAVMDNLVQRVKSGANAHTPAFVAHGKHDEVVLPSCGSKASELLKHAGVPTLFVTYPMGHSSFPSEMEDLNDWLLSLLGERCALMK